MKNTENAQIDRQWPDENLEEVGACPYCGSNHRSVAYRDVQDWTFESAPGRWTYWDYLNCNALYLDPRPTEKSIGSAYRRYYTHDQSPPSGRLQRLKYQLLNECWSHWLGTDIRPRLGVPRPLAPLLRPLYSKIPPPFELEVLATLPQGDLLDVGCGSGSTLKLAALLGWKVTGLELDTSAVRTARSQGLNVVYGTYHRLQEYPNAFDYVICSHLLEHVHQPHMLLGLIKAALKDNGVAIISCPNSQSYVRHRFGASWRGLEAPRHLAISSLEFLIGTMKSLGFSTTQIQPIGSTTIKQSRRILESRRKSELRGTQQPQDELYPSVDPESHPDLIQLVCRKIAQPET